MDEEILYLEDDQIARLKAESSNVLGEQGYKSTASTFVPKDSVLGIFELDFKPFLVQLQLDLSGLRYNEKDKKYEKVDEPLMDLECIRKLVNLLRSILFLNTPMTNLDEDRIKMSISAIQKSLDRLLFEFGYEHGVNVSILWYISRTCGQQIENALYRSKDGLERQLRASNISVQSQQKEQREEEKKKVSIFPNFFRRKAT